jgi:hypothetical protein
MKRIAMLLVACTLLTSIPAFAGGHYGHSGGGYRGGNAWGYIGAGLIGAVVADAFYPRGRVIYVQPGYYQPTYQPAYQQDPYYGRRSTEYYRGLADAQRRRYDEQRRLDYEQGLRDGGGY